MKYYGTTRVMVPWEDFDGTAQRTIYTFRGTTDRRRLWREVRKGIQHLTQRKICIHVLRKICIVLDDAGNATLHREWKAMATAWLQRIQEHMNETESTGASGIQTEVAGTAGLDMPNLQDRPEEARI